jgi:hypothetical protein
MVAAASRLTERDVAIIRLVHEHRVLTTDQVRDIAFSSLRRAEERLAELHHMRVVERFRPVRWPGSAPCHWVLDEIGVEVVAAEQGVKPAELRWRRERALGIATSQRLPHLVGVNGFFTALLRSARTDARAERLSVWWSEGRCAAEWGEVVRPDGYGIWTEENAEVAFLLEYNRATEPLTRLVDKLAGYACLAEAAGGYTWVLFCVPGSGREAEVRRAFAAAPVPVATAVVPPHGSPAEGIWLPVGLSGPRLRLAELGPPERRT